LLVAVGGGTLGDAAGFFAASYLRGIDWCPLATTSLSLADSAIGGKTAINGPGVKNLMGAFHQPLGVYGALEALHSLPRRHLRSGLAEITKCAVIADAELFAWLERNAGALEGLDPEAWEHALVAANAVKAAVVAADPRERGGRAVLNFGHTVGHALEAVDRPRLLHGEAISLGMIAASWVSEQRVRAEDGLTDRIRSLLGRLGLPVQCAQLDVVNTMKAIGYDKKTRGGRAMMVLTPRVGLATFGHEVEWPMLDRALRSLSGLAAPKTPPPAHPPARPRRGRGPTRGAGR
jgi:3-dehydroquinate synthase